MIFNGINYQATETASEFHHDNGFVIGQMGPIGCGKSVSCMMHILGKAVQQEAGYDGIRRSRWAIIRNTYPQLKSTTIKTWKSWVPENKLGKIKFDSPISQLIKFNDVEIDVLFLSMDSPEDIDKLMSLELTGIYINEAQFIHKKIFKTCLERVNRYPSKKDGAKITWTGVIFDTNPPDTDHWMYRLFEESSPKGYKLFKYKSAIVKVNNAPTDSTPYAVSLTGSIYINNIEADYIQIQNDPHYWLNLVSGSTDEEIKVNLMGEYGIVVSGKAVHGTYNDAIHYAGKILVPNPHIELGLGFDFGLTPACAIVQLSAEGQFQVIDELWSEDMDLRDFTSNVVIPHLDRYYPWWRGNYVSFNDPAGSVPSQTDGKACEDILLECGIKSRSAAESNDPTPRRDGLKYFLGRMTGGRPACIVSSKCSMIRKGLMGYFQYARIRAGGDERYHEKPLKNIYSHICEALEYIAMRYAAINKKPVNTKEKPHKIRNVPFMGQ